MNPTNHPTSLIHLAVHGPKEEPLSFNQFVDVKPTDRAPSEMIRFPVPIQPNSSTYLCAEFDAEKAVRSAETMDAELRLEAIFDPAGIAETTMKLLGSPERQKAVDDVKQAAVEQKVPAAFPVYVVPDWLDKMSRESPPSKQPLKNSGADQGRRKVAAVEPLV